MNNNEHAVFSDDKYKEAHKIFKKMERHERYLIERDNKHGTVKFSYENDLSYFGHKGVDVFDDINQEIQKKYEESIDDILAGEYEEDALEENVPGQITMDDLLSDWTKIKERNTQDLKNSIHKNVVEQTGRIFEKKTNTGEIFEDEPAGSIWDEVDRVDEFEEDLSDNEVYEENIEAEAAYEETYEEAEEA